MGLKILQGFCPVIISVHQAVALTVLPECYWQFHLKVHILRYSYLLIPHRFQTTDILLANYSIISLPELSFVNTANYSTFV